ncbi:MAG: tRNA (N6-isopentenyl adenosine(37)-C2)-methylthiotransferase MiaB, partial [Candidatus Saganbacteria bacterium]|nr:tRNA (N6-isopentenyl adenosine(37)-C2)-methylthiotransferase MiaB [Candidatus Saganbacteria bacterium]
MNDSDSEKLAGVFKSFGITPAKREGKADIILVNTCVVRQNAEDRAAGYISSLKRFTKKKPNLVVGICGCMVPEPERNLKKKFPHVKLFIPPNSPDVLIEYLQLTPHPPLL